MSILTLERQTLRQPGEEVESSFATEAKLEAGDLNYLELINRCRAVLDGYCDVTPLAKLDQVPGGVNLLAKYEAAQRGDSFKTRGAYVQLKALEGKVSEVACASAGNFGVGVAEAAKKLKIEASVYIPTSVDPSRADKIIDSGRDEDGVQWAKVILVGDNVDESLEYARNSGHQVVEPFNSELAIAGHGTVAREIIEQAPGRLRKIFVAIGGGSLTAGTLEALTDDDDVEVVAVQMQGNDSAERSVHNGGLTPASELNKLTAGSCVNTVGDKCLDVMMCFYKKGKLSFITVDSADIGSCVQREIELRQQHEPAMGEAAFDSFPETTAFQAEAGARKMAAQEVAKGNNISDETWVVVCSGSNVDKNAEDATIEASRKRQMALGSWTLATVVNYSYINAS